MNLALRERWRGRVWRIAPYRLVEERDDALVLWSPPGSPVLRPVDDAGAELRVPGDTAWRLLARPASSGALGFVRPGSRWSIWVHFVEDAFRSWYVNFERDHVRAGSILDFVDEKLDFVVKPDGTVRWKDEDELEQAAASGYLDAADVRAQAEAVLADPPWPTGWEGWRPDPAWPVPELPPGWEDLGGAPALS